MPTDLRLILATGALALLSACAHHAAQAPLEADFEQLWQAAGDNPTVTINAAILAGELATKRGLMADAAQYYQQAAALSEDPQVAQRATQLALQADDRVLAGQAAQRWIALDQENAGAFEIAARLALREGDYAAATAHLKRLLALDKTPDGNGLVSVAEILALEPQAAEQALDLYREVVKEQPVSATMVYAEAFLAYRVDQADVAQRAVDKALTMRPDWQRAQLLALRLQLQAEDGPAVEQSIQQLHVANPKSLSLRLSLGSLLLEFDQVNLARSEFRNALKIDKNSDDALYALGLIEMDTGDLVQAKKYFTRLQNRGQRLADTSYYLGRIAEQRGQVLQAMQLYREVRSGRRVLDAAIRQAVIISRQGELKSAREYLETLRNRFPHEALRLWQVEAELLYRAKHSQQALDIYQQALQDYPQDTDLLYGRAIVLEQMGEVAQAEADLRAIIEQHPDDARSLNALGYMLSNHSQRYAEASKLVRKALELTPDDPAIIDSLGWLYFRQGKIEQAREYLEKAWMSLKDPEVAAHLGEVLWLQGDTERARGVWEQGLQLDPQHDTLRQTMERLDPQP